jgi:hypothetical protein
VKRQPGRIGEQRELVSPPQLRVETDRLERAGPAGYAQLAHCNDFFTMSNFRDLLFHAQEHRYRIAELVESAAEAGLEFVGFELPEQLVQRYREQFPDDSEQVSLANWRRFEVQYAGSISLLGSTWRKKEPNRGRGSGGDRAIST